MAEREFEITPYGVDYVCDQCNTGLMQPHGRTAWLTDPIQHPHRCTNCGHEQAFTERYPTVRWRRGEVIPAGVAPSPECRFNGHSTRSCSRGVLGCVIDHKERVPCLNHEATGAQPTCPACRERAQPDVGVAPTDGGQQ